MSKTQNNWVAIYEESLVEMKPQVYAVPKDYLTSEELRKLGVTCGERCMVHKSTILVNPEKLVLGDDVRIDGFCTISCGIGIYMGKNIHVAGYVSLFGGAGIVVGDYASIASGSKVYSISDDLMGRGLVGPCVPLEDRYLHKGRVYLGDHSVLAVNSTVMPGGSLGMGSTLLPNAMLTSKSEVHFYAIMNGTPAKFLKDKLPGFAEKTKK